MPKQEKATEENIAEESNKILDSFNVSIDAGKEEDDIKMDMIGAGATFKNVTRLYNDYMVQSGRAMTKEAKSEVVETSVKDVALASEEGFDSAVAAVVKGSKGVNEKSAAGLVRAWAKKAEVECYAKPKGSGATRNPFVNNFHAALIENPNMDEAGLKAVIAGLEEKQQINPTRWFNQHNSIRKMVNKIAEGLAA